MEVHGDCYQLPVRPSEMDREEFEQATHCVGAVVGRTVRGAEIGVYCSAFV